MIKEQRSNPGRGGATKKQQLRRAAALEQAAACERSRNFPQAEQAYLGLIRDDPRDPEANLRLAELYRQIGRTELALPLLRNLAGVALPAPQLNLLGAAWHRLGHAQEAKAAFERAVAARPDSLEFRFNLGLALRDLGSAREAADCFSRNLAAQPDHLPSLLQLGAVLREDQQLEAALEVLQRIVAIDPGNAEAYRYMALMQVDLVQIDAAIRSWEKVLELDPTCALTHLRLSHLRKRGHDIAAMESLYASTDKSADRINLAFALGKALEDEGDYDRAFRYLFEGNRLKRSQFRYSIDEWRALFEELADIFSADFLLHHGAAGVDDDTPIFIVGMPRSGSSLVEQILASHGDVFGAGELKLLPKLCADGASRRGRPFPAHFRELSAGEWGELGYHYLRALRRRDATARRITDKLPQNFRFIGAIAIALPRARIIHCRRSPMDNCWSIFKNLFAEGHPYSYDLQELGRFYRYYRDLMAHWDAVLPGRVYHIDYEKLVAEPDSEISALLAHCELAFDRRCIDFHRNARAVDTMSAAQVKQPINRDSIERWTRFRAHLEPLARELEEN